MEDNNKLNKLDYNPLNKTNNNNKLEFDNENPNNNNNDITIALDKTNDNDLLQDQTDLELKKSDDYDSTKPHNSKISDFILFITAILFFINLLLYIPLMVIFRKVGNPQEFKQFWYISLIGMIILVIMSIMLYLMRTTVLDKNNIVSYILFPVFILILVGVISIFASYNFALCFSLNILTSIGFIIVLFLHFITSFNNLNCFKVFIIYMFFCLGNILFIIYQKDFYVEFFTTSVFISVLFTYLVYRLNN